MFEVEVPWGMALPVSDSCYGSRRSYGRELPVDVPNVTGSKPRQGIENCELLAHRR